MIPAMNEQDLFQRLRTRARQTWPNYEDLYGPLDDEELEESERFLGFVLPGFVRRLYTQVGNGGFGPGYGGVLGLIYGASDESLMNAVDRYLGWQTWEPDPSDYELEKGERVVPWTWPKGILAICHWGCAIYSCIDCTSEEAPVLRFRQDCYHPTLAVTDLMIPESACFSSWLEAWLEGTLHNWVTFPR
jgi:SMI1 / KNR4 family (SUKH-1)